MTQLRRAYFLVPLLAVVVPLAVSNPAGASPLTFEPHRFETADGRAVDAEIGTMAVPEHRRTKSTRTIELTMVRFKSTNPNPTAPIVYLAGGPGGSGIETARGTRFELFMALREVADVIAFDQRGTGASAVLPGCSRGWSLPLDRPATRARYDAAVRKAARFCARQWRNAGIDLDAYNTEESADDLEDLRRALGVPRLSLWSISYGSHLAMSAMRRHPDSLERVVLAGPEGPDHTVKRPRDSQRLLEAIDARIHADPRLAAVYPDFLGDIRTVLRGLDKRPVRVQLSDGRTMVVGKFDVQLIASWLLGGPEYQALLPAAFRAMADGNFEVVAKYLHHTRAGRIRPMSAAMDAASGVSARRRRIVDREARTTLLEGAINFPWRATQRGVSVRDLGRRFRAQLVSSVPTLVISGTLDGRTPVANARELLPGLSRGHHLLLHGAGHSDPLFLSHPDIAATLEEFFAGRAIAEAAELIVDMPPIAMPQHGNRFKIQ